MQPSRALAGAEAGASSAAPQPPPPQQPPPLPTPRHHSAAQTTPHACSGLALSPRSRLLVSAVPNCLQQQKRARKREGESGNSVGLLSCYLTSLDSKVCVPAVESWLCVSGFFMKMDVVFIKCWWVVFKYFGRHRE